MKTILLYSGGMDSYIAWEYLERPETLFVNFFHKYWEKEQKAINATIPKTKVIPMGSIGLYEKSDAEIPNRNLILAIMAALEGADKICIVVQKDEMGIPDRTYQFFLNASKILSELNSREIEIFSPFYKMDKTDMVRWYMGNGCSLFHLLDTVGCYSSEEGHCGNCPACLRRYIAFKNNGVDPGYELKEEIKQQYKKALPEYSKLRQERMAKWL